MAAYSFANLKIVGSHVGVSIGADGPSQMGLEDIAIFRPIPGCLVLYPSDAYSAEALVQEIAKHRGISYLRTSRPGMPLIYDRDEKFPIGGSKVLKKNAKDVVTVIGAGITLHEALKAYEALKKEGIYVRVIDAYSVSPIDAENIARAVKKTSGNVVVAEDHFAEGGLGDAVSSVLKGNTEMVHLAVKELPRSGQPEELLDKYGISARHIQDAVKSLIERSKT
jgi:transketolase